MDTIDNAILALTANIEFKDALKQLKNFEKNNKGFKLKANTEELENAYDKFVKNANKKPIQAFNFSNETGTILSMTRKAAESKIDGEFYNDFYTKLEKYTARMNRANSFVKDMVEQLGKTEEEIIDMISRMSSTDIKNLVGNKTNEYGKWEEARKRAKTLRGQSYGETARERANNIAIQRENQGTRAFKNAYVENGFTDTEKKGIDAIAGKVDDKDLQKIVKDYLELETILKRVEVKKEELSQIDNKDEATLKQILQLTADASRLRMLMGQDITKSNGAMQKFAESNKELKLVDPETETSENRKQKIQEARKSLMRFYQQELEQEANDATDSIIKMFKEAFERAKASISESADTFGSLGNIDKSVRKYIQNINSAKDAEQKLLEVSEKLKGSKGVITSENIEYAKDGVGYLRRYVELGGDINKLYEKISPSMKQFFDNFSNGQVAPEFMNEFQKIYEEVGKAKDLKIGFGVGNGEGTGSVGQVNDELERQSQIVEKLGEDYKNVAKYAVGAEEALAKVEELAKRSNSKKGITDLERKDMIGYAARFNAINTNDNLAFSEVAQKAIEDNQKKYFATANKVTEMSKKLSSSASDTGNGVGGITPEQLKTLTGYLQQIIDKLKEIKDLSNNKTSLFNDSDIEKFTQSMQEAINKLDFSKVSESIEKINFKAISEEAEKAIITIAKKFETLGEQIAQNIANGINNGVKISEDTIVPKNEEIKKEVKEDKAETKPEKKVATIEDLDKEVERYTELKTKITDCDTELEKLKSRRKEPIISPEDIDGIENYLHKLSQVRDSKSSMYDTSSDDNFNFVSKDNSDELSKLEISLDNLIQKCEPLKNFTFDFEQFASAEEASEALTDALEQELSVLKQVDLELEKQITTLSNSRATMTSQLNKSVNSITNMKKELGVDTTILDLDEAVNKLNALNKEIVDCEEKIRSLKETEKTSLVSEQDIQQMKQLNEVFNGIKYNPRSFDVTESWQEFDTMLGKSNVNEEIKTKLSKTAREIAQTSSMTGNPVSIQKQILEMLQREITEQESLVSANREKIKVENEEVIVTQNRLTQLQQEKSELQEMVNLIKEKLQLQSATTSQPSNQIPVSSGNTSPSTHSISNQTNTSSPAIDAQNKFQEELKETQKQTEQTSTALLEMQHVFENIYAEESFGSPDKLGVNWAENEEESLKKISERLKVLYSFRNKENFEQDYGNEIVALMDVAKGAGYSNFVTEDGVQTLSKTIQKYFNNVKRFTEARKLLEQYDSTVDYSITQTDTSSPTIDVQNKNGILMNNTTSPNLKKLGVTEDAPVVETDNSQQITREQQSLICLGEYIGQVIKLVNEKTAAFEKEQQVVDGSVQREITALTELSGWLISVKEDVDKIATTIATLPSINIKADLSGLNSDKLTEDIVKKFSELSKALKDTDTSNITSEGISTLNSLNISKNAGVNLQKVANAITNIKASLNNLGDGGKAFIEDIKEIVNAGEALKNFNEILKKTKTERKEATKQATGQSEDKPKTKTQQSNELYGALSAKKKEYLKLLKSLTYAKDEQDKATITQTMSQYEQETAEIQKQIESQKLVNQAKQAAIDIIDDNIAREEYLIAERNEWTQANTVNLAEQLGSEEAVKELGNLGTEWDKALKAAYDYKNVLGDTVDIVRQIRRDSKGDYYESYTITGKDGNQITKGKDGTYLMSRQKVVDDLTQQKAREKESKKNKNTTTTTSSNNKIISEYKELISLEEQLHALKTKQAVGFGVIDEDINKVQREIDTKKAGIEKIKETTALTQKETDAQAEYNNKVAELQNMYSKNSVGFSGITDFTSRLEQVKTNIPELSNSVQDTYTKIEKLTESFAQGKTSITDYQKKINKLVTDLENVERVIPGGSLGDGENALRKLFAENGINVKKISRNKDQTKVTFSGTQLDETKKKLVEVAGTFDTLTGKVSYFEKGTSKAMTSLQKSISAFKGKMQSVVRYFATFVSVYEVIGAIKSGVGTVIEFNTALSEMRKVSSASTATLKELQERSFEVADQVGSTALQIQKSTADFLRLGKSQQKLWLAPLYRNV